MDYQTCILSAFLKEDIEQPNIFAGFNMSNFINKVDNNQKIICSICLENCINPMNPNGCKHIFCTICIKTWAKMKRTCPLCRKRFFKINKYQ